MGHHFSAFPLVTLGAGAIQASSFLWRLQQLSLPEPLLVLAWPGGSGVGARGKTNTIVVCPHNFLSPPGFPSAAWFQVLPHEPRFPTGPLPPLVPFPSQGWGGGRVALQAFEN